MLDSQEAMEKLSLEPSHIPSEHIPTSEHIPACEPTAEPIPAADPVSEPNPAALEPVYDPVEATEQYSKPSEQYEKQEYQEYKPTLYTGQDKPQLYTGPEKLYTGPEKHSYGGQDKLYTGEKHGYGQDKHGYHQDKYADYKHHGQHQEYYSGGYNQDYQEHYNQGHHYRQSVDEDEKYKIIVRHLNYKTTEDTVGEHFSQYGAVRTVNIKKDPDGSSRGFGFVVFESEESLSAAIASENQRLDNHDVIVTKPIPLSEKMKTNMLFVGGLHRDITEEQLRGYFTVFGEITEIIFVENRQTSERKGFCFVHFKENEAVERITEGKNPPLAAVHNIDEYKLDCKKKFPDNHPEQRKLKQRQAAKRYFGGYGPPNGGYGGYGPPPDYYQGGYGGYNDYNGGYHNGGGYDQGGYQNNYDQGYNNGPQRGRGRGGYKPY